LEDKEFCTLDTCSCNVDVIETKCSRHCTPATRFKPPNLVFNRTSGPTGWCTNIVSPEEWFYSAISNTHDGPGRLCGDFDPKFRYYRYGPPDPCNEDVCTYGKVCGNSENGTLLDIVINFSFDYPTWGGGYWGLRRDLAENLVKELPISDKFRVRLTYYFNWGIGMHEDGSPTMMGFRQYPASAVNINNNVQSTWNEPNPFSSNKTGLLEDLRKMAIYGEISGPTIPQIQDRLCRDSQCYPLFDMTRLIELDLLPTDRSLGMKHKLLVFQALQSSYPVRDAKDHLSPIGGFLSNLYDSISMVIIGHVKSKLEHAVWDRYRLYRENTKSITDLGNDTKLVLWEAEFGQHGSQRSIQDIIDEANNRAVKVRDYAFVYESDMPGDPNPGEPVTTSEVDINGKSCTTNTDCENWFFRNGGAGGERFWCDTIGAIQKHECSDHPHSIIHDSSEPWSDLPHWSLNLPNTPIYSSLVIDFQAEKKEDTSDRERHVADIMSMSICEGLTCDETITVKTCDETGTGADYRGCQTVTENGYTCVPWRNVNSPYPGSLNWPEDDSKDHNFCRNYDGEPRPWCYTNLAGGNNWDYCNPATTEIQGLDYKGCKTTTVDGDQCVVWEDVDVVAGYQSSYWANVEREKISPMVGNNNTNMCGNDYTSVSECFHACKSLPSGSDYDYYEAVDNSNVPKGCFLNEATQVCKFNRHSKGAPHPNLSPICASPKTPSGHNQCRNPDNSPKPWCYTSTDGASWGYCH
jgi:hypothetical protein